MSRTPTSRARSASKNVNAWLEKSASADVAVLMTSASDPSDFSFATPTSSRQCPAGDELRHRSSRPIVEIEYYPHDSICAGRSDADCWISLANQKSRASVLVLKVICRRALSGAVARGRRSLDPGRLRMQQ
jgi:hypothetical protein